MFIEICFKDNAFTPTTIECDHYDHNDNHRLFLIYPIKNGPPGMMIPDNSVNYIRTVLGTDDINKEEKE